jgi:hypothetical protein
LAAVPAEHRARESNDDWTLPPNTSAHFYQTLIASGVMLGLGTGWYLLDDRNVLDWDKPSLKSRLTGESWRFDNNRFGMNFVLHPLFGAGIYAFARDSHYSAPSSFLASFLTSMTWEFVVEYNERVSINDVIVTPLAGFPIGEFAHKVGYYLSNRGSRSAARTALGWTLSPVTRLAQLGCDHEPTPRHAKDALGNDSGLWHEFYTDYGVSGYRASGVTDGFVQRLRTGGNLVSLPSYRSPGRSSRAFWNAELSRLDLVIEAGSKHFGVDLSTDTTLAGFADRDLSPAGNGHSVVLGVAVGYKYKNSFAQSEDERMSWVGFPGVATDAYWSSRKLSSELSLRLYPVFGGASSPAFQRYRNTLGNRSSKTILENEGYFYGWGLVGQLQARQNFGGFHSEVSFLAELLASEEGLDRDQQNVEDDTKASDISASMALRNWFDLPHSFVAGIEMSARVRESRAGDIRQRLSRRNLGLWLGTRF